MSEYVQKNELMTIVDSVDVQSVAGTLQKIGALQNVIKQTLKAGHDFDTIPGTNKPTLLKPGAEKVLMLFGLTSEYEIIREVSDYEKGIFAFTVKCVLSKQGVKVTEGLGECNSKEEKYRYRNVYFDQLPLGLDPESLKKDRNGRYKVENDEIFSIVNTILKMAKKRAQVDAVLTVASLSEIFTQDLEDMRSFIQAERKETMTADDADKIKVNFGKYSGKTVGQIAKEDRNYVEWLAKNAKREDIKQAASLVLSAPEPSEPKQRSLDDITAPLSDEEVEEYFNSQPFPEEF